MYKMIKIKYTGIFVLLLLIAGCDPLDVEPQHSIPADEAIQSENDVLSALNGCYSALQGDGYYGLDYIAVPDLVADNLIWSGTTAGYNQLDNNSILADNSIVEGMWSDMYSLLTRVNDLIYRIEFVEFDTEGLKDEVLGELYFMRALAHFDLVRLFGDIPIRNTIVTGNQESLNIARTDVDDVFQQIWDDIEASKTIINESIMTGRASKPALLALEARASLFYYYKTQEQIYLNQAISAASEVIDDFGLQLETDYATLFSGNENSENIFVIEFNEQDRNLLSQYFLPTDLSGRNEFSPPEDFTDIYSEGDIRVNVNVAFNAEEPYVVKYPDLETGTDNVIVFRLAEMYLLRAEANAILQSPFNTILADVNAVRERAGLLPFDSEDYNEIFGEIMTQKRLEFAYEGHRWFDLVRTNTAVDVLEGVTSTDQTLFPIPLNEILANDAIDNEDQNPGY